MNPLSRSATLAYQQAKSLQYLRNMSVNVRACQPLKEDAPPGHNELILSAIKEVLSESKDTLDKKNAGSNLTSALIYLRLPQALRYEAQDLFKTFISANSRQEILLANAKSMPTNVISSLPFMENARLEYNELVLSAIQNVLTKSSNVKDRTIALNNLSTGIMSLGLPISIRHEMKCLFEKVIQHAGWWERIKFSFEEDKELSVTLIARNLQGDFTDEQSMDWDNWSLD